jgi:hypothetical protein
MGEKVGRRLVERIDLSSRFAFAYEASDENSLHEVLNR